MSKCDIDINFDRSDRVYRGGEIVSGEVLVRVNKDINCNGIILSHYWRTHGRGNVTTGLKHTIPLCESQPLQAGEELQLPFEFVSELWPLTYRGNFINLDHYVHVGVDVPWAIDPKHAEEFIVIPGQRPPQFTGSRSELIDIQKQQAKDRKSRRTSLVLKLMLGVITLSLLAAFTVLAFILVPLVICVGLIYWFRKKAVSGRVGKVELATPVVVVGPGEDWPCVLEFTPKKTFRINEISARLLVQEIATSGSGTNKTTFRTALFDEKQIVLPAGQLTAGELVSEHLQIPLPDCDAWSLDVSNNILRWTIEVRIDIPRCPDWSQKTTLMMIPTSFLQDGPTETAPSDSSGQISFDKASNSSADHATVEETAPATVFELVSAINNADRYGNERTQVISAVGGQTFGIAVIVDRTSTTLEFAESAGPEHRQGRTILGKLAGTDQDVQLFTRQHNNAAIDAIARDEVWESQATVAKWDSLYNRLVMLEV